MSDHIFGYQQRRLTATNRWARNGNLVQAGAARSVLYTLGQVAQYRRKVVLSHCVDLDSIPTGNTGTTTRWIARFRSGLQASELHYHMVMALDSERTPSVDPYVVWALTEVGTGTTNSEALHFGYSVSALTPSTRSHCLPWTMHAPWPVWCTRLLRSLSTTRHPAGSIPTSR